MEERSRGSVKLTRLQCVYRYLHSTALHLAGAGLERILQTSDLETDVESFSPPPNDKLQSRPGLSPAGREAVGRLEAGPTQLVKIALQMWIYLSSS